MERQRVRRPAWRRDDGVFSGPEGCLEWQGRPDVLHDSLAGGEGERSQESAVFPDRVAEPVIHTVISRVLVGVHEQRGLGAHGCLPFSSARPPWHSILSLGFLSLGPP